MTKIRALAITIRPALPCIALQRLPHVPNPLPILGRCLLVAAILLLSTTVIPRHGGPAPCDPPGSLCRP